MKKFHGEHRIIHQTNYVDTPQQNERVRRNLYLVLKIAKALRFQAHLPLEFWRECVLTATYMTNKTPSPMLDGKIPYEILFMLNLCTSIFGFVAVYFMFITIKGQVENLVFTIKGAFLLGIYMEKGWESL